MRIALCVEGCRGSVKGVESDSMLCQRKGSRFCVEERRGPNTVQPSCIHESSTVKAKSHGHFSQACCPWALQQTKNRTPRIPNATRNHRRPKTETYTPHMSTAGTTRYCVLRILSGRRYYRPVPVPVPAPAPAPAPVGGTRNSYSRGPTGTMRISAPCIAFAIRTRCRF